MGRWPGLWTDVRSASWPAGPGGDSFNASMDGYRENDSPHYGHLHR